LDKVFESKPIKRGGGVKSYFNSSKHHSNFKDKCLPKSQTTTI